MLTSAIPSFLLAPGLLGVSVLASCLLAALVLALGRRTRGETCWFCHAIQSKSSRSDSAVGAGWTCTHCQQYNGFTEVLGEREGEGERVGGG